MCRILLKTFWKLLFAMFMMAVGFDIDLIIVFRGICLLVISSLINLVEFHLISNVWKCAWCSTTITDNWSNRRAIDKKNTMKSNDQNWKLIKLSAMSVYYLAIFGTHIHKNLTPRKCERPLYMAFLIRWMYNTMDWVRLSCYGSARLGSNQLDSFIESLFRWQ